jgi:transcriptional regulator, AraC family
MKPPPIIQKYGFNAPSILGIEVKPLDFLWEKRDKADKVHRADFYQILWVQEGSFSLQLDFEEVCLHSEQALFIVPGQVVHFHLDTRPQATAVLFVPEFLGEIPSDLQALHRLRSANLLGHKAISLAESAIDSLLHQMMRELSTTPDEHQAIIIRSYLRILLAELGRRLPSKALQMSGLVGDFINAVEVHHHRLYNIQDYQQKLGVTEKQLASSVRESLGMTPKTYLDERRLLEAKRYLSYSDLSIKEVAFALNFDEPTNFNKFFRRHTGTTPQAFRLSQRS